MHASLLWRVEITEGSSADMDHKTRYRVSACLSVRQANRQRAAYRAQVNPPLLGNWGMNHVCINPLVQRTALVEYAISEADVWRSLAAVAPLTQCIACGNYASVRGRWFDNSDQDRSGAYGFTSVDYGRPCPHDACSVGSVRGLVDHFGISRTAQSRHV